MTDDIVNRLRIIGCFQNGDAVCTCVTGMEAADTITALRAEVERLTADQGAAFAAGVEAAAHWIETVPETLPNRQEIARAIRAIATKGDADERA